MELDEAIYRWTQRERVDGVAFALNESVCVESGDRTGALGVVISLVAIQPTIYRVELSDGSDVDLDERAIVGASAIADAKAIARLQRWYAAQCNEDWEHSFGVTIDTLDNPGWRLRVDLKETSLEGRTYVPFESAMDTPEWIACRLDSGTFECACGPGMLSRAVRVFMSWAEEEAS